MPNFFWIIAPVIRSRKRVERVENFDKGRRDVGNDVRRPGYHRWRARSAARARLEFAGSNLPHQLERLRYGIIDRRVVVALRTLEFDKRD
jgi:hypothetical protein